MHDAINTTSDTAGVPALAGQPPPRWRGGLRIILKLVGAGAAGAASYVLGGPALALVGVLMLLAVAVVATAIAIMLAAMLRHRDPRSPFVRLMLITCAVTNRRPADYLPPAEPKSPRSRAIP